MQITTSKPWVQEPQKHMSNVGFVATAQMKDAFVPTSRSLIVVWKASCRDMNNYCSIYFFHIFHTSKHNFLSVCWQKHLDILAFATIRLPSIWPLPRRIGVFSAGLSPKAIANPGHGALGALDRTVEKGCFVQGISRQKGRWIGTLPETKILLMVQKFPK